MYALFSGCSAENPFETLEDRFDDEASARAAAEPLEDTGHFCAVVPLVPDAAVYLTAEPEAEAATAS